MKAIFILTFVLIIFSVALCEEKKKEEEKTPKKEEKSAKDVSVEEKEQRSDFDLMEIMVDCNETFRVEMSYLESLNKTGSFPDETDRTPKCYLRCVLEKSEVASDDGVYDVTKTAEVFSIIRGLVPVDDIKEIATGCSDRSEMCKCERAYQYLKCLFENEISKYETT